MKQLKEFTIKFVGLKLGEHCFEYQIDNKFFEHFEYDEFNDANINARVILNKKTTLLEFNFEISGTVNVNCDLTNEPFNQEIQNQFSLVVNFGEEYNDENDEILIKILFDRYYGSFVFAHYIGVLMPMIVVGIPKFRTINMITINDNSHYLGVKGLNNTIF